MTVGVVGSLLAAIDPEAPWLAPYRGLLAALGSAARAGRPLAEALNALVETLPFGRGDARPMRFVRHAELPVDEPYEAFIHRCQAVPTRDNLHDLFNGLVWLHQPALKRRLNALQAAQIARGAIGAQRGAVRDALTLFDENAALWHAPARLAEALRARDWQALFVTHRSLWRDAQPLVVGHALMDKLCRPHKAITAHVWLTALPLASDGIDALLNDEALAARPWLPLPVLGVPGWWAGNEAPGFYADDRVFRPRRAPA